MITKCRLFSLSGGTPVWCYLENQPYQAIIQGDKYDRLFKKSLLRAEEKLLAQGVIGQVPDR